MLGNDHFKPFPNIAKLLYHKKNGTVYHFSNIQYLSFLHYHHVSTFVECFNTSKLPLKCYI